MPPSLGRRADQQGLVPGLVLHRALQDAGREEEARMLMAAAPAAWPASRLAARPTLARRLAR